MNTLKPCPFCPDGGDLQLVTFTDGVDDVVHCHTCDRILKHKIWQTRPIEDDLRKRIAELEEKQRWIPVGERLPEDKKHYMTVVMNCFDGSRDVYRLRYYGNGDWFSWSSESNVVTHWKEEPELPEVQG